MTDNVALITGCSSGIGKATAHAFRDHDWTVYATARNPDELDDLWSAGCEIERLDVTNPDHVREITHTINSEAGRLDCLVNNAGYGQFGAAEDLPVSKLRQQMAVNFVGVHRLTREFLPLMRQQETGTIVNVSSIAGQLSIPGASAYCASKAALESWSDALRTEVAPHGVDVVLLQPGPVDTAFNTKREQSLTDLTPTDAYADLYDFHNATPARENTFPPSSPEDVAEKILDITTTANPPARVPIGKWTRTAMMLSNLLPDSIKDRVYRYFVSR